MGARYPLCVNGGGSDPSKPLAAFSTCPKNSGEMHMENHNDVAANALLFRKRIP